ncbi:MAG TPA: hydrogenase maturation nickel metallochaperone HypA [Kofleriaceae bacterium]|nr:hydrogenase maturation nickel metallochaperone HypA [Kofleriaceae bacterium]
MHEYSIVAALVDRVALVVGEHPGAVAQKLHVQIGELAGVEIELLQTAFETFRERTSCERAELVIERIPAAWRCPRCDRAIRAGDILRCPDCKQPARLVAGDDITLARVEMEVRDV